MYDFSESLANADPIGNTHSIQSGTSGPIWCTKCEILSMSPLHFFHWFFFFLCSQLNAQLNPGCPPSICNDNDTQTVIHIKADAEHDTLHYIWDFRKQPSVLVALTEPNTTMNIKWEGFLNDSPSVLEFSKKPKYTMSFVLTKVRVCVCVCIAMGRWCACVTQIARNQVNTIALLLHWLIERLATVDYLL